MLKFTALFAAIAAVVLAAAPSLFAGPGGGGGNELRVEGTIDAVNVTSGDVAIKTSANRIVTVTATAATKIERNNRRATLSQFKIGDRGQARYVVGGKATKIEAVGP